MGEFGKILVVDDLKTNVRILRRRLENLGYQVLEAANGLEAMEIINSEKIDLVLLDIMMPKMDGYQVLERVKGDPELRNIPIVMITAVDDMDSIVKCIEFGADDYLTKPFNPVLLKARIKASLEKKIWYDQENLYLKQIEKEKERADGLLNVILPSSVVEELKIHNKVVPKRHDRVAVLFCDIVGFTPYCENNDPEVVVDKLGEFTEVFEEITYKHGLEKINSIGDEFMAAGGLGGSSENPVLDCVKCGLEMVSSAQGMTVGWRVRIGIHVGPVVAGVVGSKKFLFGLWGDTVNTAARMQSHGLVDSVNLSTQAWEKISDICQGESRGFLHVKGKGEMEMFRVDGIK